MNWSDLTPREQLIAGSVADGLSFEDIAEKLLRARPGTIFEIHQVMKKTGTTDAASLGAWVATSRPPPRSRHDR